MEYRIIKTSLGYFGIFYCKGKLKKMTLPQLHKTAAKKLLLEGINEHVVEDMNIAQDLTDKLLKYAKGEFVDFSDVLLDDSDWPPFYKKARYAAMTIPYGCAASYKEVAIMAGNPNASRAVGSAMSTNPIAIIVPCHRVIAGNSKLGGFFGGQEWKKQLLNLEGNKLKW